MIVNFFARESKSFSWSLSIWTWKAWQAQATFSFPYPGQGRAGSSSKGSPRWHHVHEQQQRTQGKENLASWIAKGEKTKQNNKKKSQGQLNQEQECEFPRKKEAPGRQGQLWCPARNSQAKPVGQETEECAARSESSTGTSSPKDTTEALNGRLYLWLETAPPTK